MAGTQLDLAAVYQAQGKRQLAEQYLHAAHALYRERGWAKLPERAELVGRELGISVT